MESMNNENINTNENLNNANTFLNSINEDLRNEPSLKDFKDVNGLAKSYINISKMIGRSDIPNDKSTKEDWNKFYTKLGRPESYDKYNIENNYAEYDNNFLDGIKQVCFENGITNKQFNNILNKYNELETKQEEDYLNNIKEQETQFNNEFNTEFGNRAEEVKQNVRAFVNKNMNEKDREVLNNLSDGKTIIALARLFDNIYNKTAEGSIKNLDFVNSGMSLSDLRKRMNDLKTNNPLYYETKEYQELEAEKQRRYAMGETLVSNNE